MFSRTVKKIVFISEECLWNKEESKIGLVFESENTKESNILILGDGLFIEREFMTAGHQQGLFRAIKKEIPINEKSKHVIQVLNAMIDELTLLRYLNDKKSYDSFPSCVFADYHDVDYHLEKGEKVFVYVDYNYFQILEKVENKKIIYYGIDVNGEECLVKIKSNAKLFTSLSSIEQLKVVAEESEKRKIYNRYFLDRGLTRKVNCLKDDIKELIDLIAEELCNEKGDSFCDINDFFPYDYLSIYTNDLERERLIKSLKSKNVIYGENNLYVSKDLFSANAFKDVMLKCIFNRERNIPLEDFLDLCANDEKIRELILF